MRRDVFNHYMCFIMDVFSELKLYLKPNFQYKLFGYLGERLFNCYLEHLKRTTDLRIKITPRIFVEVAADVTFFNNVLK